MPSHYSDQIEEYDSRAMAEERQQEQRDRYRIVKLLEEAILVSNTMGAVDMLYPRMQLNQIVAALRSRL